MTPNQISASIVETADAVDTISVSMRMNFSVAHLLSSAQFCRETRIIEAAHLGKPLGDYWEELQAHAIATVLTSVAGLESYVNELFVDHEEVFSELPIQLTKKLWEVYEEKSILEKYEFALLLRNGQAQDKGASPYQDVCALIKLRNALTHYKPEWSDKQVEHAKLSKELCYRATVSPFLPSYESLFPRAWMSYGTTKWAITSTTYFILDFEKRASLESKIAPFKDRLTNL